MTHDWEIALQAPARTVPAGSGLVLGVHQGLSVAPLTLLLALVGLVQERPLRKLADSFVLKRAGSQLRWLRGDVEAEKIWAEVSAHFDRDGTNAEKWILYDVESVEINPEDESRVDW